MIRQWVIYNKLEDFNSLLNYTNENLIPHGCGNLSYYKENGDSVVKIIHLHPYKNLLTSGGIFNILFMKVDINVMMMNSIVL